MGRGERIELLIHSMTVSLTFRCNFRCYDRFEHFIPNFENPDIVSLLVSTATFTFNPALLGRVVEPVVAVMLT